VDLPIKHDDFPEQTVSLPEGNRTTRNYASGQHRKFHQQKRRHKKTKPTSSWGYLGMWYRLHIYKTLLYFMAISAITQYLLPYLYPQRNKVLLALQ